MRDYKTFGAKTMRGLSKEEKDRLEEILEELRIMFRADSIGFVAQPVVTAKCDYTIKLYNADTMGYTYPTYPE